MLALTNGRLNLPILPNICGGRLSLASATPVTTTDQTAKTTVYFTPYAGNYLGLYDGNLWFYRSFSEISVAVPSTTVTPFDIFSYDNAGTVALETLNWTNDTTRATAITLQNGVYVKSGTTTRRYLGTGRTTGSSGQCEDSDAKRFLWNLYNQVPRRLQLLDTTDTWTYTTLTYRQARAATTNQVEVVPGLASLVQINLSASAGSSLAATRRVAIGEDSTTAPDASCHPCDVNSATTRELMFSTLTKLAAAGYHKYVWLEMSAASGTTTWYGDGGDVQAVNSGLRGWING